MLDEEFTGEHSEDGWKDNLEMIDWRGSVAEGIFGYDDFYSIEELERIAAVLENVSSTATTITTTQIPMTTMTLEGSRIRGCCDDGEEVVAQTSPDVIEKEDFAFRKVDASALDDELDAYWAAYKPNKGE